MSRDSFRNMAPWLLDDDEDEEIRPVSPRLDRYDVQAPLMPAPTVDYSVRLENLGPQDIPLAPGAELPAAARRRRPKAPDVMPTDREQDEYAARLDAMTPLDRQHELDNTLDDDEISIGGAIADLATDTIPSLAGRAFGNGAENFMRRVGTAAYNFAPTVPGLYPSIPGIESLTYSPATLGYESVPFSDEIGAGLQAALTDRELPEALAEQRDTRERLRNANPGTAALGMLAQGLWTGPLIPGGSAAGEALPTLGQAARAGAAQGLREGAIFGAVQGADMSNASPTTSVVRALQGPADRMGSGLYEAAQQTGSLVRDTGTGAIGGGILGAGVGGAFGAAGNAARRALTRETDAATTAAEQTALRNEVAAMESASDDAMNARPAVSDEEIVAEVAPQQPPPEDPNSVAGMRARAMGLIDRRQIRQAENAFGLEGLSRRAHAYGLYPEGELVGTPEIIDRATALRNRVGEEIQGIYAANAEMPVDLRQTLDELEQLARTEEQSAAPGAAERAERIRSAARRLSEHPENPRVPRSAERTAADIVPRFEAMPDYPTVRSRTPQPEMELGGNDQFPTMASPRATMRRGPAREAFEGELPPEQVGDDVDEIIELPEEETMAPPTRGPELTDDALGEEVVPLMPLRNVNRTIRDFDELNRDYLSGSGSHAPTPERRVGLAIRRALNRARDEAFRARHGEEALANFRQARDMYRTASIVSPPNTPPRQTLHTPSLIPALGRGAGATIGASVGGAVGGPLGGLVGAGAGGVAGHFASRLLRDYEWSIMASLAGHPRGVAGATEDILSQALTRLRGTSFEAAARQTAQREGAEAALASIGDEAERIGDADVVQLADEGLNLIGRMRRIPTIARRAAELLRVNPAVFGRYGAVLEDAARRGGFERAMAQIQAEDPQAAASIADTVDDALEAEARTYGIDPANPDADAVPQVEETDDALEAEARAYGIDPEADDAEQPLEPLPEKTRVRR